MATRDLTAPPLSAGGDLVSLLDGQTAIGGVHTFDVVHRAEDDTYYGYAGPLTSGPIDLWTSTDLRTWTRHEASPILFEPGLRWPSVLVEDGEVVMAVRSPYWQAATLGGRVRRVVDRAMATSEPLFVLNRAYSRLRGRISPRQTSISLYRSRDGVAFEPDRVLVPPGAHGNRYNQNPFLFRDPLTDQVRLFYFSGTDGHWSIRCRTAETTADLAAASDVVLRRSSSVLAAPSVFYSPTHEAYCLLAEVLRGSTWATVCFVLDSLAAPTVRESTTLFDDDVACPFAFSAAGDLYLFTARRLRSGALPWWRGEIRRFDDW